jgi:diguanylate cyclase (GGDEF)-like protein
MEWAVAPGTSLGPKLVWTWRAVLVTGLALLAAHYGSGFGGPGLDYLFNRWIYDAVEILAGAGCLVRAATVRAERWAWLWISFALFATTGGDILYDNVYNGNPPFPSFADAAYLAFYPGCYLGIGLLLRNRVSRFSATMWLDGVMAASAAAAVAAAALVQVVVDGTKGSSAVVLTNLAYPIGDVLLLALVFFVFAVTRWMPGRAWSLLAAGLLVVSVGDGIFLFQSVTNTYAEGTLLDVSWPMALVLLAFAAWHAPGRVRTRALEERPLFGTPVVCGLVAVAVFVAGAAGAVHPFAVAFAAITVVLILARSALTLRENAALLERRGTEALTDALTGLRNRRALLGDLDDALEQARDGGEPRMLAIFDLNGFKQYNDTFGHPAGDALLARLAEKLAAAVAPAGGAYRMGGDEFCVLMPASDPLLQRAAGALAETGESFAVTAAYGAVTIPQEASSSSDALGVADGRLYRRKGQIIARRSAAHEPLLRTLAEREPGLRAHVADVSTLVLAIGRELGLEGLDLEELRLAAELHDVGKLAIPDAVLQKPGALDDAEWEFIRKHTLIGQRILAGAPALAAVGTIVRSTHERWDGRGYPDGLAGEAIPLAARIVAVCDAYSAITSDRPYRAACAEKQAVAELRRCAGAQFDPRLVEILCGVLKQRPGATATVVALAG